MMMGETRELGPGVERVVVGGIMGGTSVRLRNRAGTAPDGVALWVADWLGPMPMLIREDALGPLPETPRDDPILDSSEPWQAAEHRKTGCALEWDHDGDCYVPPADSVSEESKEESHGLSDLPRAEGAGTDDLHRVPSEPRTVQDAEGRRDSVHRDRVGGGTQPASGAPAAQVDPRPETPKARPFDDWTEEDGNVLWWNFPVDEPPYVGTPLDDDWPDYKTHWTPLPPTPPTPTGSTDK